MHETLHSSAGLGFFGRAAGTGRPSAELAALIERHAWANTVLGPIERWPVTLRGYLAQILELPTPAIIFWGAERTQLYNDGYAAIMGPRHPRYFAAPYRECWPDTYPVISPLMDRVLAGEAVRLDHELFTLTRHGFTEEAYFTFSFSPLRDDQGAIAGILQPVVEVTRHVLRARRAETLRALGASGPEHEERDTLGALACDPQDLPFALFFRPRPGCEALELTNCVGFAAGEPKGPQQAALELLARQVLHTGVAVTLDGDVRVSDLQHMGVWAEPTRAAAVVPVRRAKSEAPLGALIVGLSPRLVFDESYAEFLDALGGQLAVRLDQQSAALTELRLLEGEREARRSVEALAKQLRTSEQNFRVLLESIPQQVWTASVEGLLDYVNSQVVDYFQAPVESLLGTGWVAWVHPHDQVQTLARWRESLATGQPYEVEFRLRRADGEYRWHLARAQAVRGADEAITRWFGTNTDVDEAKKIRESLRRRTEFEQYLVGIVSHDLRNPLGVIALGAGALSRNASLDAAAKKSVNRIEAATGRATKMIRDLLDFTETRLGGTIPVAPKPVDLREVLRASFEELEATHPGRRIRVQHQGEPVGEWDPDRMAQVVLNLSSNALKYSPPDSEITIETQTMPDRVVLQVRNHGAPIDPTKLPRIFEPLQRATDEVDPSGRSVGLGLYIVKQIVEAHGGLVDVSSTERGTTFTTQLPRGRGRLSP